MTNLQYAGIVDHSILAYVLSQFKEKLESSISLKFQDEEQVKKIVSDAIAEVVAGAPETFDTLKEIADYLKNNDTALAALLEAIGNKVDKSDGVVYTDTSTESNPNRKSIVLDNHDNILGKGTDGNAYNIAMVSKWNVADFGTTQLPINLNGSKVRPTYNDDKDIALLSDVEELANTIQGDYVTNQVLEETLNEYVTTEVLNSNKMTEQDARDMISEIFGDTENPTDEPTV